MENYGRSKEGKGLDDLLKLKGKSLADVETLASMSPSQMLYLKQGRYGLLRLSTLSSLADVLGCTIPELLEELAYQNQP